MSETNIVYDKNTDVITVTSPDGNTSLTFTVEAIRPFLAESFLKEDEKVRQLAMIVHEIEKQQLAKIGNFMSKMIELDKKMQKAIDSLENATSVQGVKKWDAVLAAYVKRKNVLAEVRRSIGLLERKKKPLRIRMAKLGFDPVEMTGEKSTA